MASIDEELGAWATTPHGIASAGPPARQTRGYQTIAAGVAGLSASERSACTSAGLAGAAFPSALHLRLEQSGELVDLWDCVGSA
ncbi:MAG: hypothetical protein E6G32_00170 [Actinobacteria bacterium]|nr:MAG: hypothetical protein E6G32_00170 [Actinomycetota bacterium]